MKGEYRMHIIKIRKKKMGKNLPQSLISPGLNLDETPQAQR